MASLGKDKQRSRSPLIFILCIRSQMPIGDNLPTLLQMDGAEACYQTAIAVATRQGARLWQLRASNALAALWCSQGRIPEVHALLAPLTASFDEKIMIPDLRQTKALLAETA